MMDNEFILVNMTCKDCGVTLGVLIKYENLSEPEKTLYQCFDCYSESYMAYISDYPDEE